MYPTLYINSYILLVSICVGSCCLYSCIKNGNLLPISWIQKLTKTKLKWESRKHVTTGSTPPPRKKRRISKKQNSENYMNASDSMNASNK